MYHVGKPRGPVLNLAPDEGGRGLPSLSLSYAGNFMCMLLCDLHNNPLKVLPPLYCKKMYTWWSGFKPKPFSSKACVLSMTQVLQANSWYLWKLAPRGAVTRPTGTFRGVEDTFLPASLFSYFSLSMLTIPFYFPSLTGEHLHCGLWRHVPRDPPGQAFCLPLHCFWNHPQWNAHIHPLQQILWLLQQAQGLRVHGHTEGEGKCGVLAKSQKEDSRVLGWKQLTGHPKAK